MNSLEFAVKMEEDGTKFYLKQALLYKGTTLQRLFDLLAEEEKQHEKILRQVMNETFGDLPENSAVSDVKGIFSNLDNFKDEIRAFPKQVEVYRLAREMEQISIDTYTKMADEAKNEKDKAVFLFLTQQEIHHFQMMDEFVIRIGRPEEWVEAAEFGPREDY